MKILSLGAGVNSTAILALKALGQVDFQEVVFANTGGELPETYQFIEKKIKPFCVNQKINYVEIKREGDTLYDYYFKHQIIPTRMYRHCTDKFKIQPLKKYALSRCQGEDVTFIIGFAKGEENRAKNFCLKTNVEFPLIDLGIDREECKYLCQKVFGKVPNKSGCHFCPYTKVRNWKWLNRNHPDLFQKDIALERNCSRYPDLTLHQGAPLEQVISKTEMCDWLGEACSICEVE